MSRKFKRTAFIWNKNLIKVYKWHFIILINKGMQLLLKKLYLLQTLNSRVNSTLNYVIFKYQMRIRKQNTKLLLSFSH